MTLFVDLRLFTYQLQCLNVNHMNVSDQFNYECKSNEYKWQIPLVDFTIKMINSIKSILIHQSAIDY